MILFFYKRFPFDWHTPTGYAGLICMQWILSFQSFIPFTLIIFTTVALCLFTTCFVEDLEEILRQLDQDLLFANRGKLTVRQKMDIEKNLFDIIGFFGEVRELRFLYINV